MLPGQRLAFTADRLAAPRGHLAEVEPHVSMGIIVLECPPALAGGYLDTQFLMQFARERRFNAFPRFQLTAGKFPVTFIRLAFRALSQEITAVRLHEHTDRDVRHSAPIGRRV